MLPTAPRQRGVRNTKAKHQDSGIRLGHAKGSQSPSVCIGLLFLTDVAIEVGCDHDVKLLRVGHLPRPATVKTCVVAENSRLWDSTSGAQPMHASTTYQLHAAVVDNHGFKLNFGVQF